MRIRQLFSIDRQAMIRSVVGIVIPFLRNLKEALPASVQAVKVVSNNVRVNPFDRVCTFDFL